MANKLFKSIFAVAMVLGSALGFVACEEDVNVVADPTVEVSATSLNFAMEESSQSVSITANADWKVECDADWLTATPAAGNGNGTITVAVALNDTGVIRETTIKVIALHATYGAWDTKKIAVKQSASNDAPVTEELLYGDNFDGKEATKTFGSGSSWPYIDQFPEFANAEGPASENVNYTGKGVSVRSNSTSNSDYSDYAGSGMNNIFFGSSAYFQVNNIALDAAQTNYKLTFGSEKYSQENGSLFTNSEFHVYLSKNGNGWAEIEYTFAGTAEGRWNVATAEFTLTEVPENLYIKFSADVASSYRIDDVKLFVGNGGQSITLPEEGGGDNGDNGGTTPEPGVGPYASDAAFVCAADDSVNAVYSLGDTKINGNAVTGFKLGKSKQAGKFTSGAVGVAGDKYLNFYAQGWKGGDVTLYYRVNGGATQSQKLASHDGVTGNPPYASLAFAESDHYSVKLTGLTADSTIEFSTDANFELTSADATMPTARAIVCGVKLSDEPINGEEGGETPEPEDPIEGSVTIAEAIAAADGAAIVIENATVIGVYSRGVLVEDTTGKLLVYVGSAVDAKVGDVVKVEGSMATYGGLRQVGTPTVTVTGSTSYTYPTATVMDGAAMDAYLSNPVIQYVEYTGTLAISGYYYNVTVDGAATAVGSLAYVIDGTVDPALDGQKILVKGWTIGFSGGKYVNTMITSVTAADGGTTEPEPEPEPTPEPGDVFVITFPGNPSKYTNSYTDSFTIEVGSNAFVFSGINNGQESNAWTAVRFGRKANDSVATIATSNAISYAVSSVKINFTQVDTEMNSAKLIVASDSDFTNVVEEVTAELAVGEVVYTVTSPAENLYYKLEYDMPLTGTNGSYRFDKVTYAK
ncbi:MAG: BACON domain-containing protein [Alistipes sp.]|nr:BACON domain-containing protein [Alistipes sp.]